MFGRRLFFGVVVFLLAGCASPAPPTAMPTPAPTVVGPTPDTSLPPTFTPRPPDARPTLTLAPTRTPAPAEATNTPIPFDDPIVELRYQIPALSLDRRLQGTVGSEIIYVDEATGASFRRNNQAGVLLELQQVLPNMELAELPEGCDRCVRVSYDLPLKDESRSGWLQDPVLLASIENITAVTLGPHLPPGTVVGLRRSASVYAPAHTVALTANGRLWRWLATNAEIPTPQDDVSLPELDQIVVDDLRREYTIACPGVALESLALNPAAGATARLVTIVCPEFTLPRPLVRLYAQLDEWAMPLLADLDGPQRPPAAFPLQAVLDYRRVNGERLTVFVDGTAVARDRAGAIYTDTLPVSQTISLTQQLIDAGVVSPGLDSFRTDGTATPEPAARVVVRGEADVYDGRWRDTDIAALASLNQLLDNLLQAQPATPTTTPGVTASPPASSSTPPATPSPTSSPSATP